VPRAAVVSADIANGSDLRLFGTYVQSPLCWAISTGQASAFSTVEDLKGQVRNNTTTP
jgi:hypothetical protein